VHRKQGWIGSKRGVDPRVQPQIDGAVADGVLQFVVFGFSLLPTRSHRSDPTVHPPAHQLIADGNGIALWTQEHNLWTVRLIWCVGVGAW
jgi:hypothetical protein